MNVQQDSTGAAAPATKYATNELVRLCNEIAGVLDSHFGDQFDCVITSTGKVWLKDANRVDPVPDADTMFEQALVSLKMAAMNLDPTIQGLWIGRDLGPGLHEQRGRLSCITFDRGSKAHAEAMALRGVK